LSSSGSSYWDWINRHTAKRRRRAQPLPVGDDIDREEPTRPSEPIELQDTLSRRLRRFWTDKR
jgi:hypothetical protein